MLSDYSFTYIEKDSLYEICKYYVQLGDLRSLPIILFSGVECTHLKFSATLP